MTNSAATPRPSMPSRRVARADSSWRGVLVALAALLGDLGESLFRLFGVLGTLWSAAVARAAQSSLASSERRVGKYALERKLGEGGMGVVYLAHDTELGRLAAVKLPKHGRSDVETFARFEREARLTAELQHANTARLYDRGRAEDGTPYYATELLEGASLEEIVEHAGPLPPARVVHVLCGILAALVEVHGRGIVHRDIKPSNVLLCERSPQADRVKLLDFGLAKGAIGDGDEEAPDALDQVVGTPHYLAPEAIVSPSEVDARADLYALGALGYFLLTGKTVFRGGSAIEVCRHHLLSLVEPPSHAVAHSLPRSLEELVLTCLEKDPSRRPTAAQALERLANVGVPAWTRRDAEGWWAEQSDRGVALEGELVPVLHAA